MKAEKSVVFAFLFAQRLEIMRDKVPAKLGFFCPQSIKKMKIWNNFKWSYSGFWTKLPVMPANCTVLRLLLKGTSCCVMYLFCAHSSPQALALNHCLSHIYTVWLDSKQRRTHFQHAFATSWGTADNAFFNWSRILPTNFSRICLANTYKMLNIREAARALESVRIYEAINLK